METIHSLGEVWKNVTPVLTGPLAKRIKARRVELKKTQKEAARTFGMAQGTYSKIEAGRLSNPAIRMADLCLFLELSPLEVFQ